jgi:hypothetical protein
VIFILFLNWNKSSGFHNVNFDVLELGTETRGLWNPELELTSFEN